MQDLFEVHVHVLRSGARRDPERPISRARRSQAALYEMVYRKLRRDGVLVTNAGHVDLQLARLITKGRAHTHPSSAPSIFKTGTGEGEKDVEGVHATPETAESTSTNSKAGASHASAGAGDRTDREEVGGGTEHVHHAYERAHDQPFSAEEVSGGVGVLSAVTRYDSRSLVLIPLAGAGRGEGVGALT